jgi:hypothetical protein
MVEAVVSCGVVPLETGMFGVIVPKQMILPAPEDAVPTAKWVSVSEPAVAAAKAIVAAGLVDWAVAADHPPVDLATVALA